MYSFLAAWSLWLDLYMVWRGFGFGFVWCGLVSLLCFGMISYGMVLGQEFVCPFGSPTFVRLQKTAPSLTTNLLLVIGKCLGALSFK